MAIPNQTFIQKTLPTHPNNPTTGKGMSMWGYGCGSKHTGITYLPTKKKLYFSGGDVSPMIDCDTIYAGNHGLSFTYDAKECDLPPNYGWKCVGGACRAAGQISPMGLDQPPTCYDPKEDCVWVCSAKANETSNPALEVICTCADHPTDGPKPSGSQLRRGVYKVNINSADQGSWEWELAIPAGTDPARSYVENMPGWDDGLRYDNVLDCVWTIRSSYIRKSMKPFSSTNFVDYPIPVDPDAGGFTSGPQGGDSSNNHFALDVIGRWAYWISGITIYKLDGNQLIIDPRLQTWPVQWELYIGGSNYVSPNQFTVNNDRTADYFVGRVVRTQGTGTCVGMIETSVYQAGSNTTLVTLQINAGDGAVDAGLSAIYLAHMQALNAGRYYRFHLDTGVFQKLPDPPYFNRLYQPSAFLTGGPFYNRGWSTEIDVHMDTRNRAVLHPDHGLGGPTGEMLGMYVWDTTLRNDSGKIRQHSGNQYFGTWTTLPGAHPSWQYFPVVSTGPQLVEANEHYYDPGENVLVLGGSEFGSGSIYAMWHWRYK